MDWGGEWGDREFPDVGGSSCSLCRSIEVVIGVIGNFLMWEGHLAFCVALQAAYEAL